MPKRDYIGPSRVTEVTEVLTEYTDIVTGTKGYVSATEWGNGEGVTLEVTNDQGSTSHMSLSWEAWDALRVAVKKIYK